MKKINLFFIIYTAALWCAEVPLLSPDFISTATFEKLLAKKEKTAEDYLDIAAIAYQIPEAENLLVARAAQDPQIYKSLLLSTAGRRDFKKLALYAEKAIEQGIIEGYYYAACARIRLGDKSSPQVQAYLDKAAFQKNDTQDEAKLLLAHIAFGAGAMDQVSPLLKELDAKNIGAASLMLGYEYLLHSRNYTDKNNTRKAYDYFMRAIKGKALPADMYTDTPGNDAKTMASIALGMMWELNKVPQDRRTSHENHFEKDQSL